LVFLDAQTVSRSLVYCGVEVSTDGLASSLDLSVCESRVGRNKDYVDETDALLDRIAEPAA
jgi:hypothetical protein